MDNRIVETIYAHILIQMKTYPQGNDTAQALLHRMWTNPHSFSHENVDSGQIQNLPNRPC